MIGSINDFSNIWISSGIESWAWYVTSMSALIRERLGKKAQERKKFTLDSDLVFEKHGHKNHLRKRKSSKDLLTFFTWNEFWEGKLRVKGNHWHSNRICDLCIWAARVAGGNLRFIRWWFNFLLPSRVPDWKRQG